MKKVDCIVAAPHFLTMAGEGVGYRADHAMAIDRGKITGMGPRDDIFNEYQAERVINAGEQVVLPGFIDAHMHTNEAVLRGLAQDTGHWMMYGLGPFEEQLTPEDRIAGSQLALLEAVRAGTTTFSEFSRRPDRLCDFFRRAGVRANITVTIREAIDRIYAPGELYEFDPALGEKTLETCRGIFHRYNETENGRFTVMFGPQAADFVSENLLAKVKAAAVAADTKIHMHVQQGDRETYQLVKRCGLRPIAYLDRIGYLDERLVAVHLTDADNTEAALVAQRGASMVICSGSIGIIDGIVPPLKAFQDAGGLAALGSDQAPGNNNHNIFNEMKLTALFNKIRAQDPEIMPAWKVLRMATIEGASVLGLDHKIGSLEEGKRADFICVDLTAPTMMPVYDHPMRNIVPNLVYSARGSEVRRVAVDGQIIFEDNRFYTLDEKEIIAVNQKAADALGCKAKDAFQRIDGTNARFMREEKL